MSLKLLMTTHNRYDLLEKTIKSISSTPDLPHLYVVDDKSIDLNKIQVACSPVVARVHQNIKTLGHAANTPNAIKEMFEEFPDCDAVLVLDSDILFSAGWLKKVDSIYKMMSSDKSIAAIQILNLANIENKTKSSKYSGFMNCDYLTACGMIVTRRFFSAFAACYEKHGWDRWDMLSTKDAKLQGLNVLCSEISLIQHTGGYDGSHSGAGQVSYTFKNPCGLTNMFEDDGLCISKNVVIVCGTGFHNYASAVIVARSLEDNGFTVSLATGNQCWDEFVVNSLGRKYCTCLGPMFYGSSFKAINKCRKDLESYTGNPDTFNFDLDSDNNRWKLFSMSGDLKRFLSEKVNSAFGISGLSYSIDIVSKNLQIKPISDPWKNLHDYVVINCIESDGEDLIELAKSNFPGKKIMKLVTERLNVGFRKAVDEYFFDLKPDQILSVLKYSDGFVSRDTRLSFACAITETKMVIKND